jgi:hypothetical protein
MPETAPRRSVTVEGVCIVANTPAAAVSLKIRRA